MGLRSKTNRKGELYSLEAQSLSTISERRRSNSYGIRLHPRFGFGGFSEMEDGVPSPSFAVHSTSEVLTKRTDEQQFISVHQQDDQGVTNASYVTDSSDVTKESGISEFDVAPLRVRKYVTSERFSGFSVLCIHHSDFDINCT